jgi:SAM-dependent methyltransferase
MVEGDKSALVYKLDMNRLATFGINTVSATFHGRDIFAPLAAEIAAKRVKPQQLGPPTNNIVPSWVEAPTVSRGRVVGDIGTFDLVTAMEVIEHVSDKRAFIAALAARLAPGGLLALSTPNRTPQSRLLMVGAAETFGLIPRGTHHWDDFVTPEELDELLEEAGLDMGEPTGIAFSPTKGLHLSDDLSLNYLVTARAR